MPPEQWRGQSPLKFLPAHPQRPFADRADADAQAAEAIHAFASPNKKPEGDNDAPTWPHGKADRPATMLRIAPPIGLHTPRMCSSVFCGFRARHRRAPTGRRQKWRKSAIP
jgi:hypothetical protein